MNRSISILLALAVLAACGAAMSVQAQTEDVAAQSDATWKTHTAFDGQISKIIEGNRYVYVFAHQAFYHDDTDYKLFKTPRGTVLYIDKQNPGKGVHGLFDTYRPTGNDVRVLNYNPRTGTLWICYSDGGIDVLEDSGTMHSIKALRSPSMAKMGQTGTVSFDLNDDAWIAMDRGYVRIDGATYEVKECVYVDSPVESICLVGDKVVAIVGDAFYDAPESGDRTRMESFRKHTELSVTSANRILPVSATSFATLIDGSKLSVVTWKNGNMTAETKVTDATFSNQLCSSTASIWESSTMPCLRHIVANRYENNFIPVRDGYLAFSSTTAYFVPMGSATGQKVASYKFPVSTPRYVGTLDFDDFWFYERRKGFYSRAVSTSNGTWSQPGAMIQWHGPVGMELADMEYSPVTGVTVMNRNSTPRHFSRVYGFSPMLLSGYKGGTWTNYSPIYGTPRSLNGNSNLTAKFNNERSYPYPSAHLKGFMIDPLHPEYAVVASVDAGIVAVNMTDIEGQILRFTDARDGYKDFPGYMENFETKDGARFSWTQMIGADADNVIWACLTDVLDYKGQGPRVDLMYWTPESRNEAMTAQDISKAGKWKYLTFPLADLETPLTMRGGDGVALKHPKNKNKIVVISNNWGRQGIVVCDHNGTLEDASDDKAYLIYQIKTRDGLLYHKEYIMAVAEDPVTGNVWLSFNGKLISVDLTKLVKDGIIEGTEFKAVYADGSREPAVMSDFVYSIAFDEYNRMWVGTATSGVYGISADRRKVIAHYDMTNSPMLSNQVDGLCWDPDGNELMIGTNMGLHSVKPDQVQAEATGTGTPMAYPANVLPEYRGNVKFVNLPAQTVLSVTDAGGRQIKQLPAVDNGQTVWDVCDTDGQPVPQGVYTVKDVSKQVPDFRIIVSR